MVSFYEALNLFSILYAFPAVLIYIVFLVVLFKNKDSSYSTVFFDYIRLLGIVDLSLYFLFYGSFRAGHFSILYPIYEAFIRPNWLTTFWLYFVCVLQHSQHYIHLFISINRCLTLVLPPKFQRHLKTVFRITVILTFITPGAYLGWIVYVQAVVKSYSKPDGLPIWYAIDTLNTWPSAPSKGKMFAIVGGVCYSIALIFNIITVFHLTILKTKVTKKRLTDIKLFIISLFLFFVTIIHCIFFVFLTFFKGSDEDFVYYFFVPFQCLTYDLATLSTPFCFMLLSPSLRKSVIQIITLNSNNNNDRVAVITKSWT